MTVDQLISELRSAGFAPGCPTAVAQTLFDRTMKEICQRTRLRATESDISLVAGTREYTLADAFHVSEAYYQPSSDNSGWTLLAETDLGKLSLHSQGWRIGESDDVPSRYYFSTDASGASTIGFDPVPSVSTSSGYPRVRVYHTKYAALSGDDDLPSALLSEDVLLSGMCYRWFTRTQPEKAAFWKERFDKDVDMTVIHSERKQDNLNFTYVSPFAGRLGRVI